MIIRLANISFKYLIILLITLLVTEFTLRLELFSLYKPLPTSNNDKFWVADDELGWTRKPNISGNFTNGYFNGQVSSNKYGIRLNADKDTFVFV